MTKKNNLATQLIDLAVKSSVSVITAESCTGGMIGAALTAVSGSSRVYEGGVVSYSNDLKKKLLGVDPVLLDTVGAVSPEVACAMAEGAALLAPQPEGALALSVTGIAGPGGGSAAKPVGLVYIGVKAPGREAVAHAYRFGDIGRDKVREATVDAALTLGVQALADAP